MHIEFLVEELSAEEALMNLLPNILGETVEFDIHAFRGKKDLLSKLPQRLKSYAQWMSEDMIIVVLIDEDREDCHELKDRLERMAAQAGLRTKTGTVGNQSFQVVNRIAVEELEAWFFGDVAALKATYPRIPSTLDQRAPYRDPDAIKRRNMGSP